MVVAKPLLLLFPYLKWRNLRIALVLGYFLHFVQKLTKFLSDKSRDWLVDFSPYEILIGWVELLCLLLIYLKSVKLLYKCSLSDTFTDVFIDEKMQMTWEVLLYCCTRSSSELQTHLCFFEISTTLRNCYLRTKIGHIWQGTKNFERNELIYIIYVYRYQKQGLTKTKEDSLLDRMTSTCLRGGWGVASNRPSSVSSKTSSYWVSARSAKIFKLWRIVHFILNIYSLYVSR